jgi:4-amino-4-deoxy-L-arabinose transferase-like glycosyltransferase
VGLAIACAVLTKGAAAYIGPLSIGVGLIAEQRTHTTIRNKHYWTALVLALGLATSWHVAQYVLHGRNFVNIYLGLHLLQRSASGEVFGGVHGWSFYLIVLWRGLMPWLLLFPFALPLERDRRAIVLIACAVITVALFSISSTKFLWYVLPAIPAIAILIGGMLASFLQKHRNLTISAVVVFAVVGFLKTFPAIFRGPIDVPPVARLASLASRDAGVLITAPEQIQDTVIYYSDRKVCTDPTLNPLSYGYIQTCQLDEARHVIFTEPMRDKVGLRYKIRVLREDSGVSYAEIVR